MEVTLNFTPETFWGQEGKAAGIPGVSAATFRSASDRIGSGRSMPKEPTVPTLHQTRPSRLHCHPQKSWTKNQSQALRACALSQSANSGASLPTAMSS